MKKSVLKKLVSIINYSLKVDANSTSTTMAFQPKVPNSQDKLKKNDK